MTHAADYPDLRPSRRSLDPSRCPLPLRPTTTTAKLVATVYDLRRFQRVYPQNYGQADDENSRSIIRRPRRSYLSSTWRRSRARSRRRRCASTSSCTSDSAPGFDVRAGRIHGVGLERVAHVHDRGLRSALTARHSPSNLRSKQVVSFTALSSISRGISAFALADLGSSTHGDAMVLGGRHGLASANTTVTYQPFPPAPSVRAGGRRCGLGPRTSSAI